MVSPSTHPVTLSLEDVRRLWFSRQGFLRPREKKLTKKRLVEHLEKTGGLQLDTVNVLNRAHLLTLWSRFGAFDSLLWQRDRAEDLLGFRYRIEIYVPRERPWPTWRGSWGHEASPCPRGGRGCPCE